MGLLNRGGTLGAGAGLAGQVVSTVTLEAALADGTSQAQAAIAEPPAGAYLGVSLTLPSGGSLELSNLGTRIPTVNSGSVLDLYKDQLLTEKVLWPLTISNRFVQILVRWVGAKDRALEFEVVDGGAGDALLWLDPAWTGWATADSVQYRVDGGSEVTCLSAGVHSLGALAPGAHTIELRVVVSGIPGAWS